MRKLYLFLMACVSISQAYGQCPTADAGPDIVLSGNYVPTQIGPAVADPTAAYNWSPDIGLSSTTDPNPYVFPPYTLTYTLTVTSNLNFVVNGDFSQGNVGFDTDYTLATTSGHQPGKYMIATIDTELNYEFCGVKDNTNNTDPAQYWGKQMVIDGSTGGIGVKFWKQSVPVQPNTSYVFSFAAHAVRDNYDAARVAVAINGVVKYYTPPLPVGTETCYWRNYKFIWNSGTATTANIAMSSAATYEVGNDFAIDDIRLGLNCPAAEAYVTVDADDVIYGRKASGQTAPIAADATVAEDVSVYPSPSQGILTVQFQQPSDKPVQLSIRDTQGNVVQTQTSTIPHAGSYPINLQGIPNGVYLLLVKSANGVTEKRFVVAR